MKPLKIYQITTDALGCKLRVFTLKIFPINSEPKTKLRTFACVSQDTQSKFEANMSRGSWVMIGHPNKLNSDYNLDTYLFNLRGTPKT